MKILQMGAPKSGNFWLYQILQQIQKRTNRESKSFIEQHPIHSLAKKWELNYPEQANIDMIDITDLQVNYRISSIFKMPITNFSNYLYKTNHVWTHSPVCKRSAELFDLFDKKVYIIRDPRDMAISASKYYCSDYMLKFCPQEEKDPAAFLEKNFDRLVHDWVWHVWDHLRLRKIHHIHISFFEGFLMEFQKELSFLLDYLETSLDKDQKSALEEAVSFKTLKKDNPKHLNKGTSGYWKDNLTDEQKEKAEIIAGPLLRFLGYPENGTKSNFVGPNPNKDFEHLKQEIIASQQTLYV